MPISWLTALKVIPWGDVIEHAPKVLKAARDLLSQQRQRRGEPAAASPHNNTDVVEGTFQTPPDVGALDQALKAAREDLDRLQQTQGNMAQTLADLAEQNSRLVAAVEVLRKRTRLLLAWLVVLLVALVALWLR